LSAIGTQRSALGERDQRPFAHGESGRYQLWLILRGRGGQSIHPRRQLGLAPTHPAGRNCNAFWKAPGEFKAVDAGLAQAGGVDDLGEAKNLV